MGFYKNINHKKELLRGLWLGFNSRPGELVAIRYPVLPRLQIQVHLADVNKVPPGVLMQTHGQFLNDRRSM